ncbi:hypothetical protein [Flavobacterium sp. CFS9]|uniref:hypothetical protein n=1 Tax=Flavobacterium sp. CFS9 TaxID=3143118 RepID=UPI0034E87299
MVFNRNTKTNAETNSIGSTDPVNLQFRISGREPITTSGTGRIGLWELSSQAVSLY